ncbi:MAG: hypothetical protein ACHQAY_27170 [Hyphomicrobiales bacterium]
MQFGKRNIRSSGRNSGSIEITLPVKLAVLEGVPCQVGLRDGLIPEIVLQPDLCGIVPVFEALWERLGLGLENVGAIGDFSEADYALGLFPTAKWGVRPSLAYADGLLICRSREETVAIEWHALEAAARLVESMAAVAGRRLSLSDELAALFGNQVAYLLSGGAIGARDAFMRGFASQATTPPFAADGSRANLLGVALWRDAQPELARLYDQFASWDDEPETLTKAREHWYRARRFEAHVAMTRT